MDLSEALCAAFHGSLWGTDWHRMGAIKLGEAWGRPPRQGRENPLWPRRAPGLGFSAPSPAWSVGTWDLGAVGLVQALWKASAVRRAGS